MEYCDDDKSVSNDSGETEEVKEKGKANIIHCRSAASITVAAAV